MTRAVQHFPEVQAAQARREASSAQTGQARAELLPSVNLGLSEGRERSDNISTRALGRDPTLTRREADLSVTQLLFDGGAAAGQVKRFGARTEGAAFTVIDTYENAGLRAGLAFVDVRRLREQLGVAQENATTHQRTLADVTALADAGRGRRADVVQAQARSALAGSAVEQLQGQLSQAEAAYNYVTGRFPERLEPPAELALLIPARFDEAVDALQVHPAMRAAQKELEAAQYDRESARARLAAPRVTIEAGTSRNRDVDGIAGPNRDHYAMLRLRYNLFRGFGDSERVRETTARSDEALADTRRVRNEISRDLHQTWGALAADRARLPQLALHARASADVVDAYRLQFQLGQRSLLDVLNAENERYNAAGNHVAGRAAVSAGELRLLASIGRLLERLGVPMPGQPLRQERGR